MSKIEFIAYDGGYPNLCHGNLILKIDGNLVEFNNVLESGGQVGFDENWEEYVVPGDWSVDSKFVFINEPLMSNNGTCNFITNEFINQTAKRVSSHRKMCR